MEIECQICFESHSKSLFPKITANCNHGLNICELCVNKHIKTQLDSKGVVEINCPFNKCNQKIQNDDIKKISKELFERFDTLLLRQTLSKIPEFRWCKNSECNSGQIHFEGDDAPIMTCHACKQKSCYTHDIPWHQDSTCSEYEITRKGNDKETRDLLEKETKPCPQCGVRIIKGEGCNHIICGMKKCHYEFCWLCFADYNEIRKHGNTFHKKTCRFYA
ncbi:hypothetical protein C1645_800887 [Glomus cerebriforme]|uniref:RBR-type E3 ubiquitin transferase n=1 Tax=Glomus cerebriforme TaxID=658196 RepID=A0A397TM34_9GLOM|nr:hypothetical protein C1645_800887 [Glomus cerebriforme]